MTNIMDGMGQARFNSGNPKQTTPEKKNTKEEKNMPTVIKNLKNGS
ncbi:hypothetical protein [Alkalihalobacterium alkalinitrilicum]|nr:hypothetical protein [Alkalihalobacterium alkalinitrilicum]